MPLGSDVEKLCELGAKCLRDNLNSKDETLKRWEYDIPQGTLLERYETLETKIDEHKFFSYFRKKGHKSPWGARCQPINPCEHIKCKTTKPLRLIAMPYKTVNYINETTKEDKELALILSKLASRILQGEEKNCTLKSIDILINQGDESSCLGNNDYRLLNLLCKTKYDGFIRVVNNTDEENIVEHIKKSKEDTHDYDEIAICKADDAINVISRTPFKGN